MVDYTEKIAKVQEAIAKKQALIEKRQKSIEKCLAQMNPILIKNGFKAVEVASREEVHRVYDDLHTLVPQGKSIWDVAVAQTIDELNDKIWEYVDSIENAQSVIEEKKHTLATYQQRIDKANEKLDFLKTMPVCFTEFRDSMVTSWDSWDAWMKVAGQEAKKEMREEVKALRNQMKQPYMYQPTDENDIALKEQIKELEKEYSEQYGHYEYLYNMTTEQIHEQNFKRATEFVIDTCNRVLHITGDITDATDLKLTRGNDNYAVINGFVIGVDGKAEIRSIGAGGYNIQRWHIRTLVLEKH